MATIADQDDCRGAAAVDMADMLAVANRDLFWLRFDRLHRTDKSIHATVELLLRAMREDAELRRLRPGITDLRRAMSGHVTGKSERLGIQASLLFDSQPDGVFGVDAGERALQALFVASGLGGVDHSIGWLFGVYFWPAVCSPHCWFSPAETLRTLDFTAAAVPPPDANLARPASTASAFVAFCREFLPRMREACSTRARATWKQWHDAAVAAVRDWLGSGGGDLGAASAADLAGHAASLLQASRLQSDLERVSDALEPWLGRWARPDGHQPLLHQVDTPQAVLAVLSPFCVGDESDGA